jgi:plastocyanin
MKRGAGSHATRVVVVAASISALVLGVVGNARTATPQTTGVDPLINVSVRITDKGMVVKPLRVARLETVAFRVVNAGKLTHDFRVVGLKTGALKHGQVGHILVQFTDRGQYLYRCALHCSVKTRGYIHVYSPLG